MDEPNLTNEEKKIINYIFYMLENHLDEFSWDLVRHKKTNNRHIVLLHDFKDEQGESHSFPVAIIEPPWKEYITEWEYNNKSKFSIVSLWTYIKFKLGW